MLRRVLNYQLSVATLLEVALYLAIPYVLVGLVWTFVHPSQMQVIQEQLETTLPAGADLVAFGVTTALWPMLLFASGLCA